LSNPSAEEHSAADTGNAAEKARQLLELVTELLSEAQSGRAPEVRLESHLEKELGLDSLGRTELFGRVERHFGVSLPEQALLSETPGELLQAVLAARGGAPGDLSRQVEMPEGEAAESKAEPAAAGTLAEALQWHVQTHPERTHIFLYEGEDEPKPISYQALWQGARRAAAGLVRHGVKPGDRVALMLPTGQGYFYGFFGTLLAGGVPVPIYPPTRPSQLEEHLLRHARILQNAGTRVLITVPEARAVARLLKTQTQVLEHILTPDDLDGEGAELEPVSRQPGDLAFLQYTSGSTGDPKGVRLTHADLLANIRAMGRAVQVSPSDVFISWLPLYHDMGLIGAWLGSLYFGMPLVVMSPLSFLSRPSRWLWAIHRHKGTLSASPNFGYELCRSKIPAEQLEGLDLSSWRWAFNGAEPVSPETLERFADHFAPHGFRGNALAPVYGLAEAAVGLAFPPPGRGPLVDSIRRDPFTREGRAQQVPPDHPDALHMVACGRALPGYQVRIVDGQDRPLPERREGTLQFQGPSATAGYFENPEATRSLYHGEWLDTGDLAYLADGEIYVTGRIKELIIRGGRNIFPYEVEQAVGELPGIRKGCVAVFAATDERAGTERVVVVAETRERDEAEQERLRALVHEHSTDLLGGPPDEVVIAPPHTVLKTSSGKIRRSSLRSLYEQGHLQRKARAVWWQVLRVLGSGLRQKVTRLRRRSAELLFAGWAWAVFCLLVPPVWLSTVLLPRLAWRWGAIRAAIRTLRGLTGVALEVEGREHLPPPGQPCVLVANHQSYLDSLAVIEAIPRNFVYIAKRELVEQFFSHLFLQRLDTLFVERFDLRKSAAERDQFTPPLRAGRSLAFFPEGTFRGDAGLLPFRMGAFVTAVEAGVPVLPVSLRGTRAILGGDSWMPHRHGVRLVIGPPLQPDGSDWSAAARLQDRARSFILEHCGEQDLAGSGPGSETAG